MIISNEDFTYRKSNTLFIDKEVLINNCIGISYELEKPDTFINNENIKFLFHIYKSFYFEQSLFFDIFKSICKNRNYNPSSVIMSVDELNLKRISYNTKKIHSLQNYFKQVNNNIDRIRKESKNIIKNKLYTIEKYFGWEDSQMRIVTFDFLNLKEDLNDDSKYFFLAFMQHYHEYVFWHKELFSDTRILIESEIKKLDDPDEIRYNEYAVEYLKKNGF